MTAGTVRPFGRPLVARARAVGSSRTGPFASASLLVSVAFAVLFFSPSFSVTIAVSVSVSVTITRPDAVAHGERRGGKEV